MEKSYATPSEKKLEAAVLGAVIYEKNAIHRVSAILDPDCFYFPDHQLIYRAVIGLMVEGVNIDMLTVIERLKHEGVLDQVGGPSKVVELTGTVASTAHLEEHAYILKQYMVRRAAISLSWEMAKRAADMTEDSLEVVEEMERRLFGLVEGLHPGRSQSAASLASDEMKRFDETMNRVGLLGVPSYLETVDDLLQGFKGSDLVYLAARPGMGKTSYTVTQALSQVSNGKKIAFFSLEMSNNQLFQKLVSMEAEVPLTHVRDPRLMKDNPAEKQRYMDAVNRLSSKFIFIDDQSFTLFGIASQARKLKREHDIDMIYIDYIQLMTFGSEKRKGQNREQEVSAISRGLKLLAKELNIPVFALAQLSRDLEKRTDKTPKLSDLRESGSLEQDADLVLFIDRPEMHYKPGSEKQQEYEGKAGLYIAKFRHGNLGKVRLFFNKTFTRFEVYRSEFDEYDGHLPEQVGANPFEK